MKNIIEMALDELELLALTMADASQEELEKVEQRYNALLFGEN